ncbi:MAG: TIGR01777 family oxidoreductase [Gemmatimonadota bacterium]
MKVLVTGASGFVGSALLPFLTGEGHFAVRLVRSARAPGRSEVSWDPQRGAIDLDALEGIDAAIHLAGESIAAVPWTAEGKRRIRESRVGGTRLLCESFARLDRPPKTLVCASAVGYYGDRGHEMLREDSPPGTGFLAQVCKEWEAASEPAERKGIRVVRLRIGMVLSPTGGALARMLGLFRAGLGGRVGSGDQYMSWIALDDLVGVVDHAIRTPSLEGPVNAVSPRPVTNREFAKILGRVLGRPAVLPAPAFAVRLILGEMADDLLLASARVVPERLLLSGYAFRHPELEGALRHLLGRG